MANLTVSAVCNQRCAYCFTFDHLGRPGDGPRPLARRGFLPVHSFQDRLDFLARSGIDEVRLLGGEPTLHPQFAELVGRAVGAGRRVVVFSNGLMPDKAVACLEALAPNVCTVLVNVTRPPAGGEDAILHRQRETMVRLGPRVVPGLTIYQVDLRTEYLLPLIAETGCKPILRLGMAQPCLSGNNQYIHPHQYRAVAIQVLRLARVAAEASVSLDVDCGFVRCMFSDADLEALEETRAKMSWRCSPILDVDLEGQVIHCYPLSQLARLPLTTAADAAGLQSAFEARTRHFRQAGVFKECSACAFKSHGECPGGCLATTIRRFRHAPLHMKMRGLEVSA